MEKETEGEKRRTKEEEGHHEGAMASAATVALGHVRPSPGHTTGFQEVLDWHKTS